MTEAQPVVVVDDREADRLETILVVRDAGFEPISVPPSQVGMEAFAAQVRGVGAVAAVLDHRLSQSSPVPFNGAQLGRYFYDHMFPAILRTTFGSAGDDIELRRHRRWLPRVLTRSSGGDEVAEAVDYCRRELAGEMEERRRPQRSLLEVVDAMRDGSEFVVDVVIPSWDSGNAVRFPIVPFFAVNFSDDPAVLIGRRFFGLVNVWAENDEDLFVEAVEPAEAPPEDFLRQMDSLKVTCSSPTDLPEVLILDVGHGNTSLVRTETWAALIDVAPTRTVMTELAAVGLSRIDDVLVSHAESDHAGGLEKLLRSPVIEVGKVWINPDPTTASVAWERLRWTLWDMQTKGELSVIATLNHSTPDFANDVLRVEILHPDLYWTLTGVGNAGTVNSMSVVTRIWIKDEPVVLLAADLTRAALDRLLSNGVDLAARVLVFPHHGGHAGRVDRDFAELICDAVKPDVVIFSIGRRRERNPLPDIVAGVRVGAPSAHIACSQLSRNCASEDRGWPVSHLSPRSAAGKTDGVCCAGSIAIRWQSGRLVFDPLLDSHRGFVDTVEVALGPPMCRR